MYFKKLDLLIPKIDYERLKGRPYEGYGETFRQFLIKDPFYLHSLIKNKIKFKIRPDHIFCIEISEYGAEPHKDPCLTVLNFYVDTADYTTIFWKPRTDIEETIIPGMNDDDHIIRAYQLNELDPVETFKAKDGDAYLLNVNEIHSASDPISNNNTRKIIRWMWDTVDFETVLNSIKILDNS